MEEGIIAPSVCILSNVDIRCSKTAFRQGCLISAWRSLLLFSEVMQLRVQKSSARFFSAASLVLKTVSEVQHAGNANLTIA